MPASRRVPAFVLALSILGCRRNDSSATSHLTIAAASSLRELLEATAPAFETAHAGCHLTFSFDASSTLSRQIEVADGFAAFLSADRANIDRITSRLDATTITSFLSNTLVMVARADIPDPVVDPAKLSTSSGRIALALEAVPAGKYARKYLAKRGLLSRLSDRIVGGENVRSTLALVESGAADYGFVYRTDAAIAKQAKIVFVVSKDDDPGIEYVAACVQNAPTIAAEYVRWLRSDDFSKAATDRGFLPPPR